MKDVADFLMKNYYNTYCPKHLVPESEDMLIKALNICKDKVFVVREEDVIVGVGVFLTLSDDVYEHITEFDLTDMNDIAFLLKEDGRNIHFILVAGDGISRILKAVKHIKKARNAKSVSWWNPDMTHLHRYNFN